MFSKATIVVATTMAAFAYAKPSRLENSCNTDKIQCCNSVQDVHSQEAKSAAELFGIDLSGLTGQAGFNCSPLAIIGLSNGGSCQTQPVCCDDNHFNGLIAVGCSPINVGL